MATRGAIVAQQARRPTVIDQGASPYSPPKANLEGGAAQAGVMPLATAGSRLAAVLIDAVLFLPAVIAGVVMSLTMRPTPGGPPPSLGGATIAVVAVLGLYVLAVGIYQIVMLSTRGQTVGKKAMKIRIVKLDGSEPGFVHAFLLRAIVNALPSMIPVVGSIYGLVDVLFIFRADRRCIHDLIASTRVIVAE
jgi:uncharacterized RDD family membrane protein YckC